MYVCMYVECSMLNDSCKPERWRIQRTDEENTIYLIIRVSYYQSSGIILLHNNYVIYLAEDW